MRDYGKVHTAFWQSPTILSLSDDGKLLALYLLTTQHGNLAGCFRLPAAYIAEDLNWPLERVEKGLQETVAKGFLNRCETTKWVFLPQFLKFNPLENPNQKKAAAKIYEQCPEDVAFRAILDGIQEPFRNPSETLPKPVAVTVTVTEKIGGTAHSLPEADPLSESGPEKSGKSPKPDAVIELPPWMPAGVWADWRRCRSESRKPLKPTTERQQLTALEAWREQGHNPVEIVQTSIRNGWQGLFEPKTNPAPVPAVSRESTEAWAEVREANRSSRWPESWKFPQTHAALTAIGGRRRLADMQTDQVPFVQREFEAAYRSAAT